MPLHFTPLHLPGCEGHNGAWLDSTEFCHSWKALTQPDSLRALLIQPIDTAVTVGLLQFLVGATLGYAIDHKLFGPIASEDLRTNRKRAWLLLLGQIMLVVVAFSYAHRLMGMLRLKYGIPTYNHEIAHSMDGGFAMSLGFAWTQRNLVQRFHCLMDPDQCTGV